MPYIIGTALLIITIIIVGLILRKKIYDDVDKKEMWKMDIMNRDTAAQLSRVKNLILMGETQQKFNTWKDRWDRIVTKVLPEVEEYLFDAEDAADRYRFSSAKKILSEIDQTLHNVEIEIEEILAELHQLLETEEKNREEMEQLLPEVKDIQKRLIQNGYQYGHALPAFEATIKEIESEITAYNEQVESGNYMEAQQSVEKIKPELDEFLTKLDEFPKIYKTVKDTLPAQIKELAQGIQKMKEEGYRVEQLGLEKEVKGYEQRLEDCMNTLKSGDNAEVKVIIEEMEERIKEIYEDLEKEALARNYIETKLPSHEKQVEENLASFEETKREVEMLKSTYYFEDSDMEKLMTMEKEINQLKKSHEEIEQELEGESISYSEIRGNLEAGFEKLTTLEEKQTAFKEFILKLRQDELKAKEDLEKMKRQVNDIHRKLVKSNVPGIPTFIWTLLETAVDKNTKVLKALDNKPLDITVVRHALEEANDAIKNTMEQTDKMIEQAYLTERVIQYANRYRSQVPELAERLKESERLFRAYEYELALENAATALEEIEPGALRSIEAK